MTPREMARTRAFWVTTAIVVGSIGLGLAIWPDASGALPTHSGPARIAVSTATLDPQTLEVEVRVGGFLHALRDVTISAEQSGRVLDLPVREGARVKKGETVARLDETKAAAGLRAAEEALREAALDPDTPAATLAQARTAEVRARHDYRLHRPEAPMDGVVEVHHVEVGEYVVPGTPLVDVVSLDTVVLHVDVDAELIGVLRLGDEVRVSVPAVPDVTASGAMTRLASRAHADTRRFAVEVELDSKSGRLKPGMYAEATFDVPGQTAAYFAPKAALRRHARRPGLFFVVDGVARWSLVQIEEVYGRPELWRVSGEPLKRGVEIVVAGFQGLKDGSPVEEKN
jgi:multidrug efflux pump subunit AcrA (membrane-fusion protein)